MQFEAYFQADEDGLYQFSSKVDDMGLLFISDSLVIDRGEGYSPDEGHGLIPLAKGQHKFKYKFIQRKGGTNLDLSCITPSGKILKLKDFKLSHN